MGEEEGEALVSEVEAGPAEVSVGVEGSEEGSEAGAGADHSFSGNFNKTLLLIIVSLTHNENRALLDGLLNKFLHI